MPNMRPTNIKMSKDSAQQKSQIGENNNLKM